MEPASSSTPSPPLTWTPTCNIKPLGSRCCARSGTSCMCHARQVTLAPFLLVGSPISQVFLISRFQIVCSPKSGTLTLQCRADTTLCRGELSGERTLCKRETQQIGSGPAAQPADNHGRNPLPDLPNVPKRFPNFLVPCTTTCRHGKIWPRHAGVRTSV
jgi:hypothetical protein